VVEGDMAFEDQYRPHMKWVSGRLVIEVTRVQSTEASLAQRRCAGFHLRGSPLRKCLWARGAPALATNLPACGDSRDSLAGVTPSDAFAPGLVDAALSPLTWALRFAIRLAPCARTMRLVPH